MRIILVSVNHRTAPLAFREKLSFGPGDLDVALNELRRRFPAAECALLSTCNRTELYAAPPDDGPPDVDDLRRFLADRGGVRMDDLLAASIHHEQERAVHHLFRLSTGLDSIVVGEPQILGQVRRAYAAAADCGVVGPVLHKLFQDAMAAAKRIRSRSGIDAGHESVGSVAVDFARQIFEDFSDKTIVGIGAGQIAKTALRHLRNQSPKRLWIVNRSPQRAADLAEQLGLSFPQGGARPFEELDELMVEADIVVSSTGAHEPLITVDRFNPLLRRRHNRPLFLIDIAVPRDVQPQIGALKNVYLYNIDDLQSVVTIHDDQRREQIEQCESEVAGAVRACTGRIRKQELAKLVQQLQNRFRQIAEIEHQRTDRKLAAMFAAPERAEIGRLIGEHTHRLINKILHLPLSQLGHGDISAAPGFYTAALRRLFRLAEPMEEGTEASGQGREHEGTTAENRDPPPERSAVEHWASAGGAGSGADSPTEPGQAAAPAETDRSAAADKIPHQGTAGKDGNRGQKPDAVVSWPGHLKLAHPFRGGPLQTPAKQVHRQTDRLGP